MCKAGPVLGRAVGGAACPVADNQAGPARGDVVILNSSQLKGAAAGTGQAACGAAHQRDRHLDVDCGGALKIGWSLDDALPFALDPGTQSAGQRRAGGPWLRCPTPS